MSRSVDSANVARGLGEGAGEDEDPNHHQQIVVGHAAREAQDAFLGGEPASDGHGVDRGNEECHGDGHGVKVAEDKGAEQVDDQKNNEGRGAYPSRGGRNVGVDLEGGIVIHNDVLKERNHLFAFIESADDAAGIADGERVGGDVVRDDAASHWQCRHTLLR